MKILKALHCQNDDTPPVWIMRQAGRYLPAYRELRKTHSLNRLFHEPELAAQVTKLPFEVLDLDGAILFSDILMIGEAFGLHVDFPENGGPSVKTPLRSVQDLSRKNVAESLSFVFKTIELLQGELPVPLIGFAGAPFTVATYFIQGEGKTKEWLYSDPHSFHQLLSLLTEATIEYLQLQIKAGVSAIQIFDSWANLLSYPHFMACSAYYLKQIVDALRSTGIPIILFCRGSSGLPTELASLGPSAISFDWQKELVELRQKVPSSIAIQGNFDPHLLKAPLSVIEKNVQNLLASMEGDPGFIVNLGHGILPDTPLENVQHFVKAIKTYLPAG